MIEHIFATPEEIEKGTNMGLLYVTTLKDADGSLRIANGLKDNQAIRLAKVELSHPYEITGETTYGGCKFRLVYATTIDGIRFLLHDERSYISDGENLNVIRNARQFGSNNARRSGSTFTNELCWGRL